MSFQQYKPTSFGFLPPVIKNLLIINVLFFLATIGLRNAFNIDLTDILGLHYFTSEKFQAYQIITYMFMHGGFSHMFFNMFALWMFGGVLERVWGGKRFLTYYLITGIGAAIIHYLIFYFQSAPVLDATAYFMANPSLENFKEFLDSSNFKIVSTTIASDFNVFVPKYNALANTNPSEALQLATDFMVQYRIDYLNAPVIVGASGAVYGLLLAFGMLFPNSMIYLYFFIPMKAKWFVVIFGVLELVSGFMDRPGDSVAHFAHLGGMIFGYFLIVFWKKNR